MMNRIVAVALVAVAGFVGGCGSDEASQVEPSPFVGSWTQTQPSGATFLWVIEEADDGYAAWVYTDQAEWCGDQPYWSEHQPELVDDVTMEFTGVTNQCFGEEPFSNSFYTGRLVFDPDSDTMRDDADPEDWVYRRDTTLEPEDLYPGIDN
jgi:hypothetical protein